MQLKDARLQALGAPVLQVGLDRLDVALVVLHVAVRGLRAVRHRSHDGMFLAIAPASVLIFQEALGVKTSAVELPLARVPVGVQRNLPRMLQFHPSEQ
jgi:hypothetical protein